MHEKNIVRSGPDGDKLLIMLHGRGANAQDILGLAEHLEVKDFSLLAPDATNHTWYPYSFMSKPGDNEPWLSSALSLVHEIVTDLEARSVPAENIYFLGFSQGACLTLEYVTRHAKKYGGIVAFTGGLIGDRIYPENYKGDFNGTNIFIGTSDPDPHVPVSRVNDTVAVLEEMNARVIKKIYKNMGHTINQDEIDTVNQSIFQKL